MMAVKRSRCVIEATNFDTHFGGALGLGLEKETTSRPDFCADSEVTG